MRATVAAVVDDENRKSLSPAWRERDLLNAVFQKVDKERHGKLTGDCDLSMFMRAWGNAPPPAPAPDPRGSSTRIHVADDDDDDDAVIEHVEDSGTGAAPEVSVSACPGAASHSVETSFATHPRLASWPSHTEHTGAAPPVSVAQNWPGSG